MRVATPRSRRRVLGLDLPPRLPLQPDGPRPARRPTLPAAQQCQHARSATIGHRSYDWSQAEHFSWDMFAGERLVTRVDDQRAATQDLGPDVASMIRMGLRHAP